MPTTLPSLRFKVLSLQERLADSSTNTVLFDVGLQLDDGDSTVSGRNVVNLTLANASNVVGLAPGKFVTLLITVEDS